MQQPPDQPADLAGPDPTRRGADTPVPVGAALGLCALLLLLFVSVGGLLQIANIGFGLWFTQVFIFLGVPWLALRWSGRDPWRSPRLLGFSAAGVGLGLTAGLINFPAAVAPLQFISTQLAPEHLRQAADLTRLFEDRSAVELALLLSAAIVAASFCEEYFFRGVLQPSLQRRIGAGRGLVLAALIFSAFHLEPVGFLARFQLGLLFGYLVHRSGSLWPAIGAHAANNLISTGLFFATRGLELPGPGEAPGTPGASELLSVLVMSAVFVPLLLVTIRRAPWSRVQAAVQPAPTTPLPPRGLGRIAAPWLIGALAALALYLALDWRGAALAFNDRRFPLPPPAETPPSLRRDREELLTLRGAAKRGEVPLSDYLEKRRSLYEATRTQKPPPLPLPPAVPPEGAPLPEP